MSDRFQVIPAAYLLIRDGERVLLQLRQNTGYMDGHWAMPAGHIERNETVFDGAVREAGEELGIEIDVADLEPLCAMHRTQPGTDPVHERVDFFLQCRTWEGTPTVVEPDKCAAVEWFDLDALPTPIPPHEGQVLQALIAGRVPPILVHGFGA